MKTIHLTYPHTLRAEELPKTVAAIGFFDGIHKGHQKVIQQAITEANERNMQSAVITFHPHPSVVLKQEVEEIQYITPLSEKEAILQQLNVDHLYIITFDQQLSSLNPQDFIDHFIVGLHIKHVVAGFDFTFGYKGKGNMNNIAQLAHGSFTHTTVKKAAINNEKISSTKIRELMYKGNIQAVNRLLGRPFTCCGLVIRGEQRGRELGYPTANLKVSKDALLPPLGVYAVKVKLKSITYNAIASIGTNPTFTPDRQDLMIEVHILDFNQMIYGDMIKIEWYQYIREEKEFSSIALLIDAMKKDEKETRDFFSNQH